jgi:hypothetical protein
MGDAKEEDVNARRRASTMGIAVRERATRRVRGSRSFVIVGVNK